MQTILNEQIDVLAKFKKGVITPLLFKINNRTIKVESIDLKYNYQRDSVKFWGFAVSAKATSYKIVFNSQSLQWFLEEIFENE